MFYLKAKIGILKLGLEVGPLLAAKKLLTIFYFKFRLIFKVFKINPFFKQKLVHNQLIFSVEGLLMITSHSHQIACALQVNCSFSESLKVIGFLYITLRCEDRKFSSSYHTIYLA